MPNRYALFFVAVMLVLCSMSGIAQANFAIHGGYLADTDACAGCHRAHTATSAVTWLDTSGTRRSALLVGPPTTQVYIFCYVCHSSGAPGAATDVEGGVLDSTSPGGAVEGANSSDMTGINTTLNGGGFEFLGNDIGHPTTSTHEVKGAAWQAWGKDKNIAGYIFMDCCSCHDPHGASNYRILKDYVNGHWVGGYANSTGSSGPGGASTIPGTDPLPLPFVISNEEGYPLKGKQGPAATESGMHVGSGADSSIPSAPTHGFRLHRWYNNGDLIAGNYNGGYEYIPSYTKARYARGYQPDRTSAEANAEDMNRGMSGWCCACHENYVAGSLPDTFLGTSIPAEYGDGATSVTKWTDARPASVPGNNAGTYPGDPSGVWAAGMGPASILVAILQGNDLAGKNYIGPDDLAVTVNDATGFPDPWDGGTLFGSWPPPSQYRNFTVQEIKYIGIWGKADAIQTNEGPVEIPKFEMIAYKDIVDIDGSPGLDTFIVTAGGRGAYDTSQQYFPSGSRVYVGYDASDGYGEVVRHRHPMNVPFTKWQSSLNSPIAFVAGDRALVLRPNEWQAFESNIVMVDIPIDHNPWTEQTIMDYNYENHNWNVTNSDESPTANGYFGANTVHDWIECLTCHRAHGTDATMSGFAGATLRPTLIEGYNTVIPDSGTDDGVPPTGDSALLRADNRGVCERCHNK